MPASTRETEQLAHDLVIEYAGFWVRLGATLIDTLAMVLLLAPLLWMIYGPEYFYRADDTLLLGTADAVINYLIPPLVILLFWRFRGATPGKMLLGMRIVDARTLAQPGNGQLIGRYLAYYLSALLLLLGFVWVAFDRRKQGLHDKLARTVVIRDPGR